MKLTTYNRPFTNGLLNFFDDSFTKAAFNQPTHRPAVNVKENDEAYVLELVAPGREKDNFELEVKDQLLTISYHHEETEASTESGYLRREYRLNNFKRSFHLDKKVINEDLIIANYENGVLLVTLPKREEALPKEPKKISVG